MSARIVLTVVKGAIKGREIVFEGPGQYTIGRSASCSVPLPNEPEWLTASRRHCLLDIDPSSVRVKDLGSRNGTFVNGVGIGRRAADAKAGEGEASTPFRTVESGDEIRVGEIVIRVDIVVQGGESDPALAPEGEESGAGLVSPCGQR